MTTSIVEVDACLLLLLLLAKDLRLQHWLRMTLADLAEAIIIDEKLALQLLLVLDSCVGFSESLAQDL